MGHEPLESFTLWNDSEARLRVTGGRAVIHRRTRKFLQGYLQYPSQRRIFSDIIAPNFLVSKVISESQQGTYQKDFVTYL